MKLNTVCFLYIPNYFGIVLCVIIFVKKKILPPSHNIRAFGGSKRLVRDKKKKFRQLFLKWEKENISEIIHGL